MLNFVIYFTREKLRIDCQQCCEMNVKEQVEMLSMNN